MPKIRRERRKYRLDFSNRLLSIQDEQKAAAEVYAETGVCAHSVKDMRYSLNGTRLTCSACLRPLDDGKEEENIQNSLEIAMREMLVEAARLFGIESTEYLIERCLAEWKKINLCMQWGPMKKLSIIQSKKPFLAYAFYKATYEERIYRSPSEVASAFDITEAKLLKAEDQYCIESGNKKIYIPCILLFERISAWLYLPWDYRRVVIELLSTLESKFFGTNTGKIMMLALSLTKYYYRPFKKAPEDIDLDRASFLLKTPVIDEKEAINYKKMCINEIIETNTKISSAGGTIVI